MNPLLSYFLTWNMMVIICVFAEDFNGLTRDSEDDNSVDCFTAKNRCLQRTTCREALITAMSQCAGVAFGHNSNLAGEHQCPIGCRNALAVLLTNDDSGKDLLHCQCHDQKSCLTIRHRLKTHCHDSVTQLTNQIDTAAINQPIACSLAEAVCRADTACSLAQDYQHKHCLKLQRAHVCSVKCRNSLTVLYSQEKARNLPHCTCEGPDFVLCIRRRKLLHSLCGLEEGQENGQKVTFSETSRNADVTRVVALEIGRESEENGPIYYKIPERSDWKGLSSYKRPASSQASTAASGCWLHASSIVLPILPLFFAFFAG